MIEVTTIQVDKSLVHELKEVKDYPRQTYSELIKKMMRVYVAVKNNNQYDEFLHKVQQQKMKELWDNPDDEAWDHV
jgi:galactose-1-phosphate uridylyltransferase